MGRACAWDTCHCWVKAPILLFLKVKGTCCLEHIKLLEGVWLSRPLGWASYINIDGKWGWHVQSMSYVRKSNSTREDTRRNLFLTTVTSRIRRVIENWIIRKYQNIPQTIRVSFIITVTEQSVNPREMIWSLLNIWKILISDHDKTKTCLQIKS